MQYFHLSTPVIAFIVNVLSQITYSRTIPKSGLLKSELMGFLTGGLTLILLESLNAIPSLLLTNILIYISLGYCYFHFINLSVTARRIRLIREIYNKPDGLTEDNILTRYNAESIIRYRMDRLLSTGQIILRNKKYFIGKPIILVIAKTMVTIKLILLGVRTVDFKMHSNPE